MAKILIVDDEARIRTLLAIALAGEGYDCTDVESAEKALEIISRGDNPDVVITDVRMAGMDGITLLKQIKKNNADIEVIIMTAHADAGTGVDAMKSGALEYVIKPFEMDEMLILVKTAIERKKLKVENADLKIAVQEKFSVENIIGRSKKMQDVFKQIKLAGPKDIVVLIRGKSGTGKELVARALHKESGRTGFTAINCSAIPANLLESELFGHEKGSFTGAYKSRQGLFEEASEGTLFLDEIGELTPDLQAKLLRVLQEKTFRPVGAQSDKVCKARIITATHRNLEDAVQDASFREDLYYRLNVFPIILPKLSERSDDIPELVDHLIKKHGGKGIDKKAVDKLVAYGWPGNVRELENVVQRAVLVAGDMTIETEHLPQHLIDGVDMLAGTRVFKLPETGLSLDAVEKDLILQAIALASGNKTRAAELLGITRRAIYSKMKTHGIEE
ncbi:MAG: sigma-54-dependent Fis family transcriptional regulator [Fibrobacteres bacterium]|nr:sigma-54-dependent Fis family transcriptional regulator [Fibrobacterota bacterium]